MLSVIAEWQKKDVDVSLVTLGKKAMAYFKNIKIEVTAAASDLGEKPQIEDLIGAIRPILEEYRDKNVDRVYLVHNNFINTMVQEPVIEQLLPLPPTDDQEIRDIWDYIYEPDAVNHAAAPKATAASTTRGAASSLKESWEFSNSLFHRRSNGRSTRR